MRNSKAFTLIELLVVSFFATIAICIVIAMICSHLSGQREITEIREEQLKEPTILRSDVQVIEKVGSSILEKHLTEMKGRRVVSVTPRYWYPCQTGRGGIVVPYYIVISEPIVTPEKAE